MYVWGLVWIDSVCELAREQRKNRRTTESLYKQTGCVGSWTLIFIVVGISRERTLEPSSIQSHFCSTMSHKSTQTAFQEIKEKKALYKQRWVEGNSITHTSVTNPFLSVCWFYISGFVLNRSSTVCLWGSRWRNRTWETLACIIYFSKLNAFCHL